MIPQKLQIKNFLSYGPNLQTIDFSNYSLICLSGKNGHGKSALLDAMTWALWGQARKAPGTAKADQGLLRLGQTQMLVVFDFSFGGKAYRIRREYMETYGKPVNVLEFGIVESETDTFIPLTDKTIRTTQEKIEQTLRIDFESFSNSAFLRQGNSNEFSKKSPKDRKQILATILGLDQYEIIRKLALEKIKDAQTKILALSTLQEKRIQELNTQETLQTDLHNLTTLLDEVELQEQALQEEYQLQLIEKNNYAEQQKQHHNFSFQLQQLNAASATQKDQLRKLFGQWRLVNTTKHSLQNITHLEQEKNNIITTIAQQQQLFQKNLEYQQQLLTLSQKINAIEQQHKDEQTKHLHLLQLTQERTQLEYKNQQQLVASTEKQIQQSTSDIATIAQQITNTHKELAAAQSHTSSVVDAEARLERRKAIYQQFVSSGNWLSKELSGLAQRKKLINEDDSSCPLCEQNLSASRRKFLKLNFEQQESFLAHRLQRLKRIIPLIKEKLITEHAQLVSNKELASQAATLTTKIKELHATHAQLLIQHAHIADTHNQQRKTLAAQADALTTQQNEVALYTSNVTTINDETYVDLIAQKKSVELTLQQHPYKEDAYKRNQERLKAIESQLAAYETVQKDIAQQENRKNDIRALCSLLKRSAQEIEAIAHKKTALGDLEAQLLALQEKEKNLTAQGTTLKKQKELLLQKKGSIQNQCTRLEKVKQEFDQEKITIGMHQTITADYHTIATATGKDGIQALLIEEAIPEIEQEANYLLSRLTNNQAQIFIESLRDLKKGGTKETLDIKISDQVGIRPYELFSGGEAFRIDFALRIAISKLLARRAGTALQLLIIDEGFGSQDDEGLGYIMDALHKIQDDFCKIIIVSHLPSMKDQFPVQFFIEKGVQGSMVTIIEQG